MPTVPRTNSHRESQHSLGQSARRHRPTNQHLLNLKSHTTEVQLPGQNGNGLSPYDSLLMKEKSCIHFC